MIHYGVPALLSFVLPGLGQLVKKQLALAAAIWALIIIPAVVATLGTSLVTSGRLLWDPALDTLLLTASGLLYLFSIGVWLWGVVDAYNRPAS